MTRRGFPAALLAAVVACAGARSRHIRPVDSRDLHDVVFVPYASSQTAGLFDPQGRPCPRFDGQIVDFFAGWQSHDKDPICDHDTFADGIHPVVLELRWQGIAEDGGRAEPGVRPQARAPLQGLALNSRSTRTAETR